MKLSQKLLKYDPYHMTPPSGSSGTSTSSKTPDLEDRWSLDRVSAVSKFFRNLHILKTPGRDLEDRWSLDRVSAFSKFFRNLLILKDSRERL